MRRSTWGLAIDSSRARILRDLEEVAQGRPLPEELGLEVSPQPLSEPLREAERDFCEEVLWLLGTHLRRGDFDRLIVAAAPRMLGHLRDRRSREMTAATASECAEDYTHLSPADLRARLREHVPCRSG